MIRDMPMASQKGDATPRPPHQDVPCAISCRGARYQPASPSSKHLAVAPNTGYSTLCLSFYPFLPHLGDKGWIRERIQRFRPSCGDFLFTHNPLTFHATSEKIDFIESRRLTVPGCWRRSLSSLSGSNSVVECNLAKVEVAGSNPVSRSSKSDGGVAKW